MSDDTIKQLHVHDWAIFNSNRYYQRLQEAGTCLEEVAEDKTISEKIVE